MVELTKPTKKVVKPFSEEGSKKQQVEQMFDGISKRYDFLNHFLSLGIDKRWRKKAISKLEDIKPTRILDVATGTADLAIEALSLNPEEIIGLDLSEGMLSIGREKIKKQNIPNITLVKGDSEKLSFPDESFDAITVAYGVRNFENLENGLNEMHRVLKKGGKLVVLEFSKPQKFPVKQAFGFYSKYILPVWGKLFSGSSEAYKYLPESVQHFPEGQEFLDILSTCAYKDVKTDRLTFGITSIYTGIK